ncbi:MAG: hypothetical protein RIB98_16330 [Acidimicrobiales bacterium]
MPSVSSYDPDEDELEQGDQPDDELDLVEEALRAALNALGRIRNHPAESVRT